MRLSLVIFSLILSGLLVFPAIAQEDFENLPPLEASAMEDGAPIRMTPDGPAIIRLEDDAASVIVGNPAQATAVLENPRLIMLIPQQPGATKLIALDSNGKAILNRHVLVGGGKSNFIRVNRACAASTGEGACQPVSMYYCPDRCYETPVAQAPAAPGAAPEGPGGAGGMPAQGGGTPETIGSNPISLSPDLVQ